MNYKFRLLFFGCLLIFTQISSQFVFAQEKKPSVSISESDKISCENFYNECLTREFYAKLSPYLIDTFGDISGEVTFSRLDAFTQRVQNSSENANGYIVYYGGKNNKYGEYKIRTDAVMNYLLKYRNLDPSRYKLINGGFRDKFEFELWISVIENISPPISSTILAEDVKFKGNMKPLGWEILY